MLSRIQSALRDSIGHDARRVGPFLIHFDAASDHPFRNYAIPDADARPSAADIAELVAFFTGLARQPRLEYVAPSATVASALAAAGFIVDVRLPLMTLARDELRAKAMPPGVELVEPVSDVDLRATALVQNIAYGSGDSVSEADIDRFRNALSRGATVVLARYNGVPAGAGMFTPPQRGLAHIAGVGVVPEFRRRGIASVVSADLSVRAFDAGLQPYLEAENENVQRLYGPLGYVSVGEMIGISLPV